MRRGSCAYFGGGPEVGVLRDCHFSLTLALSSPLCLLLRHFFTATLWHIWQKPFFLSYYTIRLQLVLTQLFLPGNDAADKLARQRALLLYSAISCSLSPLISLIHSYLFSDWRPTISFKFFDIQVPSVFTKQLVLRCHARHATSYLGYNGHNLPLLLPF